MITRWTSSRFLAVGERGPLALALIVAAACGGSATRGPSDATGGAGLQVGGSAAIAGFGGDSSFAGSGLGGSAGTGGQSQQGGGANHGGESAGAVSVGGGAGEPFSLPTDGPIWRSSTTPFCAGNPWLESFRVWSDSRGVFASVDTRIYQNAGEGWSQIFDHPGGPLHGLSGFENGPLILSGTTGTRCGILFLDGGMLSCGAATGASTFAPVSRELAYATLGARLLVYDGQYWTQAAVLADDTSYYSYDLWADSERAISVGQDGRVFSYLSGADTASELPSSGSASNYAVWGFGGDDIWVGNAEGELHHYDGSAWQLVFASQGPCSAILGMWGQDGELFFYTSSSVFRVRDQKVEPIFGFSCDVEAPQVIWHLWGNSPSEVFIALEDSVVSHPVREDGDVETVRAPRAECGQARVLYFDGQRFGLL